MGSCPDTDIDPLFLSFNITCGISKFSSAKVKMIANLSCPVLVVLRVCPREDRENVTYAVLSRVSRV